MVRTTLLVCACAIAVGFVAQDASACWDNSDRIILQLKKLDLNTEQLKEVFVFQKEHRDVIKRAHAESLGCRYHENHDAVFQKKAIGILTDAQFKKHTGRDRTKVESLQFKNRQLQKEIVRLKALLKRLEAELARLKAAK